MKIQYLPSTEKEVTLRIQLEESFAEEVKAYAEYVEMNTGGKLSPSVVAASMVKTFLSSEKKFQSWLKERRQDVSNQSREVTTEHTAHF